jgi:hypothetical protein
MLWTHQWVGHCLFVHMLTYHTNERELTCPNRFKTVHLFIRLSESFYNNSLSHLLSIRITNNPKKKNYTQVAIPYVVGGLFVCLFVMDYPCEKAALLHCQSFYTANGKLLAKLCLPEPTKTLLSVSKQNLSLQPVSEATPRPL